MSKWEPDQDIPRPHRKVKYRYEWGYFAGRRRHFVLLKSNSLRKIKEEIKAIGVLFAEIIVMWDDVNGKEQYTRKAYHPKYH